MIRSGIFFVAGLIAIFFTSRVNKFQNYVLKKFHTKYKIKNVKKDYYVGITFIIISIILFLF
jgi:uncharacterized membrane-anchored protein